ncbi:lipocalin family protein [Flavobacterium chungnamense]|uniref:Lipocalin-like domain-containing protein n=1 Tax=Flavobacterium chungnamense TaxID=706182 RepID=A0ABP7V252_9FLAO
MKTKKKIGSKLFILFLLTFYSCSHNENSQTSNSDLLIGKWEFFSTTQNGVIHDDYNPTGCHRNSLEYFANNTMVENHNDNIPSPCTVHVYPNNYTFDGTTIKKITSSISSFNSTVLTLNSTTLVTSTYNGSIIKTYKRIN